MKTPVRNTTKGFTIVELLIVVVVIAILAAITIVAYNGVTARAKTSKGSSEATMILRKLELYRTNFGDTSLPLQSNQNWDVASDLSSTATETKLPSNLRVVRGNDNSTDASITDYANIAANSTASPAVYVFFACVSNGAVTGEKIPYADFSTQSLKWVRTGNC